MAKISKNGIKKPKNSQKKWENGIETKIYRDPLVSTTLRINEKYLSSLKKVPKKKQNTLKNYQK